jgi:hypothetical protein
MIANSVKGTILCDFLPSKHTLEYLQFRCSSSSMKVDTCKYLAFILQARNNEIRNAASWYVSYLPVRFILLMISTRDSTHGL